MVWRGLDVERPITRRHHGLMTPLQWMVGVIRRNHMSNEARDKILVLDIEPNPSKALPILRRLLWARRLHEDKKSKEV